MGVTRLGAFFAALPTHFGGRRAARRIVGLGLGVLIGASAGCERAATAEPAEPVRLRQPWVELGSSEVAFDDGTRVIGAGRYRFEGNHIVFNFDYRKVGDPARVGGEMKAAVRIEGAELTEGDAAWSLGSDGPGIVQLRLEPLPSNTPGIVKFEYEQRAVAPGRRPTASRLKLCFVAGDEATRIARKHECVM